MDAKKYHSILMLILIVVLCTGLLNVQKVYADGETPTEPPAPTQIETEPPMEPPVEATALPTEPLVAETPIPEESPVDSADVIEEPPVAGLLIEVPESIEVVVLDENGDTIPLVAQEAAEIIEGSDPMWCPDGVLPGGTGCTTAFPSVAELIADMISDVTTDPASPYKQAGVIYFTETITEAFTLTPSSFGAATFNALNDYNLTLQGGWDGSIHPGPYTFTQTNFGSNPITIMGTTTNPWVGNITVNDIAFTGVTATNALTISTGAGNIALNNVDVHDQGGIMNTAMLKSTSGNILVEDGTFDGDDTNNKGFSATTNTGSITISNTSFTDAEYAGTRTTNGASLNASTVTLTNVTATGNNDGNGIAISNASLVTLNNVTASNNGIDRKFSGVYIAGKSGSQLNVVILGGAFDHNGRYGIQVADPATTTITVQSKPSCAGNGLACSNHPILLDDTAPVLTLPANITQEATSGAGNVVNYQVTVTDNQDASVTANCLPASGSTFGLGVTLVTCSARDVSGNTTSESFNITVQDTTPPSITPLPDITVWADHRFGKYLPYPSPAVSDIVDGTGVAACSPASGSLFSLGNTQVTCMATDTHGNRATITFTVHIDYEKLLPTPTDEPTSSVIVIPATGADLIALDCNSVFWAFGVKLSFVNLCDQQATVHEVSSENLPEKLPDGFSLVVGINVDVLSSGKLLKELPEDSSLQMNFPMAGSAEDQFAILYWNGSKWATISEQNGSDQLPQLLTVTIDKPGTYVLVKK